MSQKDGHSIMLDGKTFTDVKNAENEEKNLATFINNLKEIIDKCYPAPYKEIDKVAVTYGHEMKYTDVLMGGASIDVHGIPLTDETIATIMILRVNYMCSIFYIIHQLIFSDGLCYNKEMVYMEYADGEKKYV